MKPKIYVANLALFSSQGQLLLLKRSQNLKNPGYWGLIGGLVDKGEDSKRAVVRELQEETSIQSDCFELLHSRTFVIDAGDEDVQIELFKGKLIQEVSIVLDDYEHSEYSWVDPNSLKDIHPLLKGIPEMIQDLG